MTEYFEVHERDGPARLGELRLEAAQFTPSLGDEVVVDGGSLWPREREVPELDSDRVTVFPHRGMPTGTREVIQDTFEPAIPEVEGPAAVVVTRETATDLGVDTYVVSGLTGLRGDARRLVESVTGVRRAIPADTALYAPGIATPASAPLLAYLGVDLFDTDAAVVAGTQGRYLLPTGAHHLDDLTELPCACDGCVGRTPDDLDTADLVDHNVDTLQATIATVRDRIRAGRLREYLEGQVRHVPWLTAGLRVVDDDWSYLESRTPVVRQSRLDFTTDDALRRVEVQRFAERVTTRYRPRLDDRPLVLVPCSKTKPYSDSPSHGDFREAIDYRGHIASLTSPLGVVPDELELTYPAQHYEVAVTGRWSPSEREQVAEILTRYLERTNYRQVIAHVPPGGYRDVVQRATAAVGMTDVTYTVTDHPRDDVALQTLDETLSGTMRYPRERRLDAVVRAIADVQFGAQAGDKLFDGPQISGRYPRLRIHEGGEQLATLVQQYGHLALTLAGARRWSESRVSSRVVEIEAFVPHGSVLAPGVLEASDDILVGDEVVIEGPAAFGVGRAKMSGQEMCESTRGIAVDVRHVEER